MKKIHKKVTTVVKKATIKPVKCWASVDEKGKIDIWSTSSKKDIFCKKSIRVEIRPI